MPALSLFSSVSVMGRFISWSMTVFSRVCATHRLKIFGNSIPNSSLIVWRFFSPLMQMNHHLEDVRRTNSVWMMHQYRWSVSQCISESVSTWDVSGLFICNCIKKAKTEGKKCHAKTRMNTKTDKDKTCNTHHVPLRQMTNTKEQIRWNHQNRWRKSPSKSSQLLTYLLTSGTSPKPCCFTHWTTVMSQEEERRGRWQCLTEECT
jgi:hypothetical protein